MSASQRPQRLDLISARRLPGRTQIVIVSRRDGHVIERLTVLRYAGISGVDAVHAFAVKDVDGKFHVRSDSEIGLTVDAHVEAFLAEDFSQAC